MKRPPDTLAEDPYRLIEKWRAYADHLATRVAEQKEAIEEIKTIACCMGQGADIDEKLARKHDQYLNDILGIAKRALSGEGKGE